MFVHSHRQTTLSRADSSTDGSPRRGYIGTAFLADSRQSGAARAEVRSAAEPTADLDSSPIPNMVTSRNPQNGS